MKPIQLFRSAAQVVAAIATLVVGSAQANAPDLEVVEYVHRETRHFFMTGTKPEQALLDSLPNLFARTGRSFAAWSREAKRPAEAEAVIRFYVPSIASHVYTSNVSDIALLRSMPAPRFSNGFVDEGTAFFLMKSADDRCATGQKAIYRAYNNRPDGNHRYSNDLATQAATVKTGFVHEGIAFCAPNASSNDAVERAAGTPREAGEDTKTSGTVQGFVSITNFMVGTQRVNAGAARFDRGSASMLVNGAAVIIEGVVINNVLMATEVKFVNGVAAVVDEFKGFVTALGSAGKLFVNGTEIDVSGATIVGGALSSIIVGTELELRGGFRDGVFIATTVEIEDGPSLPAGVDVSGSGLAEMEGVVANFVGVASFTVNGQRVDASTATFRDGSAASLKNGVAVEVKGRISNGVLIATRVEIKSGSSTSPVTPPVGTVQFEAKGTVSNFASVSQFTVAGKQIDASNAVFLRGTVADLKNGAIVEVTGVLSGEKVLATEVKFDDDLGTGPVVSIEVETTGAISGYVSVSSFTVGGRTIDASSATFLGGTVADLKNGAVVEVKGVLVNGIVKASRISFEDAPDAIEFEAKGAVSNFVSASSFVVGGKTIDATNATFERGGVGDLKNGVVVEVKGDLIGNIVKASRVRFER